MNVYLIWRLRKHNKQPYLLGVIPQADYDGDVWQKEFSYLFYDSEIGFQLIELGDYTDDGIYMTADTEWLK